MNTMCNYKALDDSLPLIIGVCNTNMSYYRHTRKAGTAGKHCMHPLKLPNLIEIVSHTK